MNTDVIITVHPYSGDIMNYALPVAGESDCLRLANTNGPLHAGAYVRCIVYSTNLIGYSCTYTSRVVRMTSGFL